MFVENINGSSRYPKPKGYDSWLDYWEQQTGQILLKTMRYTCPACGKSHFRSNFNGAHVRKYYSSDNTWHIVPICDGCNNRTDAFNVSVKLVPVPSNL